EKQSELDALVDSVLAWVQEELNQLKKLVFAQSKLERRKAEFAKRVKENLKKQAEILEDLEPLEKQIKTWEAEIEKVKAAIARLVNPPKLGDVLNYFDEGDIYDTINKRFGEGEWKVNEKVVDAIIEAVRNAFGDVTTSFRKEVLPFMDQWQKRENKDPAWLSQLIKNQSDKIQKAQKKLEKVIHSLEDGAKSMRAAPPPKDSQEAEWFASLLDARLKTVNILSGAGMREILEGELNKVEDLQVAIDYSLQKDTGKWNQMIQDKESQFEKLQKDILAKAPDVSKKQKELEPIEENLKITREKFLSEYIPDQKVNVKDIVLYLAEKYDAWLQTLDHDQLLYEVFQRFWKEPERFPLWLQYMVVHFSGMRYASAHDSWYDPRALLLDLRTMDIQEGLKNKDNDPSNDPNYDIDDLTDEQVLEKLKTYKSQLPKWMWKEIIEVTDLRLTEVTNPIEDWETLSPEEQRERNSARDKRTGQYLAIMERWKKNIAGWRQEHDRANRLIVTRAVCNEVAEHIQHLRGHEGAAGLAQKPGWYMGAESKYYESKERKAGSRPYFVKAKSRNDFEVGASILWLRFVHEAPNPWRIAKPLETRAGDGLIPKDYLGRKTDNGVWAYKMGEPVVRTRSKAAMNQNNKKGSSKGPKETQWLRWMHEATVVEVAETAETGDKDKVVLTFETNLPDEDRSLATIGLFKRYLSDLTRQQVEDSYNAAFVGFMPEPELPADEAAKLAGDLKEMLDWNHILQKNVVPADELEAYQKTYIRNRKPQKPTIEFIDTVERVKGKADLPICKFVEWTDSLAIENKNLYKVRIWGDKKLGKDAKDLQTEADSNFQAVGVYIKETQQSSGVANALKIGREDIDKLMAMQIEDEFEQKQEKPGAWLNQKMNWLCKDKGTIYFTKGGKGWETAKSILWGIIVLGGNLVQVEGEPIPMVVKGQDGEKEEKLMAKLVGFTKSDWSRPLDELLAEGLVHRCFCVQGNRNKPADTPKGIIYSPFFSPLEWTFAGQAKPKALYLPFDYLVKPGSKDENGKVYEGIAEKLNCEQADT
ncbi:MAG TPA: hypothetical protein VJM08_13905, partial [Anaerolineales bacterium]|nr:hypothetical protein [Anaerolineales bacterium]